MKNHTDLLETIRDMAGCEFMSDLRNPKKIQTGKIEFAVEELEISDYSLEEWREAAEYILGIECHFESAEAAADFLAENCGCRRGTVDAG